MHLLAEVCKNVLKEGSNSIGRATNERIIFAIDALNGGEDVQS